VTEPKPVTPLADRPKQTFVRMELTPRTALIAVVTMAAVWLFLQLWQILLVVVVALMFVGMLNPFVDKLEKRGLGRGSAVAIVFGALFLLVAGFCALTIPNLVTQVADIVDNLPESQDRVAGALDGTRLGTPLAAFIRSLHPTDLGTKAQEYGITYAPRVVEIAAYTATSFFLALYLILDRDRMRGALFALVPRSYHVRMSRVLMNLETIVGGYMRGQAITSLLMAVFTFVVLTVAGVHNALALALFAGVADVLPYIGALLACGPAALAALAKGPSVALVVLVMIALLVGGKLLGILGALLALPIAAGIRMIIAELRVELPGEELDDPELRAKDAEAEREFAERAAGHPATEAAAIATEIAEDRRDEDASKLEDPREVTTEPITSGAP
jgi:predicted PurR-regulated permease PerM